MINCCFIKPSVGIEDYSENVVALSYPPIVGDNVNIREINMRGYIEARCLMKDKHKEEFFVITLV
tara:strand:- start:35536 stop:35730 length:195 start_codon:yes stop_codon:yes gene_type:complete